MAKCKYTKKMPEMAATTTNKSKKEEDLEENRLHVGYLNPRTTNQSLHKYFSQFGEVIDTYVMRNTKTNTSRCFGFVSFAKPRGIERALALPKHVVDGSIIEIKKAYRSYKNRTNKISVSVDSNTLSEGDIIEYFSKYGKVTRISMRTEILNEDDEERSIRIKFDNDGAVEKIFERSCHKIDDERVFVTRVFSKQQFAELNGKSNKPKTRSYSPNTATKKTHNTATTSANKASSSKDKSDDLDLNTLLGNLLRLGNN